MEIVNFVREALNGLLYKIAERNFWKVDSYTKGYQTGEWFQLILDLQKNKSIKKTV